MKPQRTPHNIILAICLLGLGTTLWWVAQRMAPMVEASRRPAGPPAAIPSSPARTATVATTTLASGAATESDERRALRAEVVERQQSLALARAEALENRTELTESDQAAAAAEFAAAHRLALDEATAAQDRLLRPDDPAAPLPGAEAAHDRFLAVRRAVVEDGLSLEEAEARFAAVPAAR